MAHVSKAQANVEKAAPEVVIETTKDKIGKKLPWLLGSGFRIPRIRLPDFTGKNIAISTPPRMIALVATYVFAFWLVMGGIYLAIREQIAMGADASGNAVWLYPGIHDAFIIESIVAASLIFLGAAGFYFIYMSTKHAMNPSYARKILILGLGMALVAFISVQKIIDLKT
ncbi:MAG: hypothetical protein ACTSU5_03805 [Promethearchaeota archaeon]